jgi:hypothetical protein
MAPSDLDEPTFVRFSIKIKLEGIGYFVRKDRLDLFGGGGAVKRPRARILYVGRTGKGRFGAMASGAAS